MCAIGPIIVGGFAVRALLRRVYLLPKRVLRWTGLEDAHGELHANPEHT